MRSLHLTSPLMEGADVRRLQHALGVTADGQYGPQTARAVHAKKYRLGFPRRTLNTGASVFFQDIVLGGKARPSGYLRRAKVRKRVLAKARKRAAVLDLKRSAAARVMQKHVGVKEHPAGSNRGPGWIDECQLHAGHPPFRAGENGWPWCGCSVHEAYRRVGVKLPVEVRSVLWVFHAAKAGHRNFSIVPLSDARRGDLVILFGISTHIEMVRANYSGGVLKTIGGNTSFDDAGDQANGGAQAERNRNPADVVVVVRVHP